MSKSKTSAHITYIGFTLPFIPLQIQRKCKACIPLISCLLWVPNATKNETNSMKSTWPMLAPRVGDPSRPIFHPLVLGVCVGGNGNFITCVGVMQILAFLDTGIPNNSHVGGISQCHCPLRVFSHCSGIYA